MGCFYVCYVYMRLHSAHDRRALIPTEALGPPGWMSEMSSFGVRTVVVAGTTCIRQKVLPVFLLLNPWALHF